MYEFRFYSVAHGRMASELALVYDMAIAGAPDVPGGPPVHTESLWERYGVPKPIGSWTALSGRRTPAFLYIMKWDSLTQRDERFPRFWTDPFWRARRAELTDGMPLVDSIENWLLDPSPAWATARVDEASQPVGGVHEMRIQHVLNGSQAHAADVLGEVDLPALQVLGARLLGVFEVVIGPERPMFVTMLAWPDLETQHRAWSEMDRDPKIAAQRQKEFARYGRGLIGTLDQYLLEPMPWNTPLANFGVSR
ncbi:hypothetical protein G6N74_26380 [Mesorhizobium sp. CGMCC 1.15528]|uniref:NIPSNAP domain-containing protein n=1 Tax=Mesorhizobium zhangyense TaxID=1776730 RepID=A0A7C9VHD7_9HYPH|nr:NIPSNAP family protein [Mesorhizobium zhangyense]NGN44591.1 hypothetical protein [Mesorhizobium zhangyense]